MFLGLMEKDRPESEVAGRTPHPLEEAVRTQQSRLREFIRRRVRNEADVEDILQDVFYQLLASASVTEPIEKLTSWLLTVARNRIIDWYRRKKTTSLQSAAPGTEEGPVTLEEILFDPAQNVDELFARSVVWEELSAALEDLPEQQREVFVMHELEGRSFREISEVTGESINTLLSRKRYAVLYLRERLRELYQEFESD